MKVRRLKRSDIKETSTLLKETIRHLKQHYTSREREEEIEKYSAKNLQTHMENKKQIFIVAEDNDKIVGVVVCSFPEPLGLCWINWIIVKEGYRRKGVGSTLISNLERIIEGRCNRIQCNTRITNRPSSSMFKKLGYRKVATLRGRVHKRDAYAWEKILKEASIRA